MPYVNAEIADKYQEFFNFMNQEHDLILTIEQMDEVVLEAQRLVKKLTIPVDVGQREQLVCYKKCGDTQPYNDICLNCGSSINYDAN